MLQITVRNAVAAEQSALEELQWRASLNNSGDREALWRIQASTQTAIGALQVSWVQIHQTAQRTDLRGAPGLLTSDALPAASLLANLPTDRRFDRFLLVRIDSPSQTQPLLYLSSSQLTVLARPVIAP